MNEKELDVKSRSCIIILIITIFFIKDFIYLADYAWTLILKHGLEALVKIVKIILLYCIRTLVANFLVIPGTKEKGSKKSFGL